MVTISLSGKVVLMTGALGGIAEHVVKRLAEADATLLLTDLLEVDAAAARLASWGVRSDRVVYRQLDVTSNERVETVVAELLALFPSCDIALGHAGGCGLHHFATTPAPLFESIVRYNFLAQTYFARAVLRFWQERKTAGHLVFTSSYVAQAPHVGIPAYAPAKAALELFGKCLALEYASSRIRVNCVAPGNVAAGSSLVVYEQDPTYRAFVDHITPFGGRNSPQAIADALLFLCSPLANEWNGQILHVDRGITIPKIG